MKIPRLINVAQGTEMIKAQRINPYQKLFFFSHTKSFPISLENDDLIPISLYWVLGPLT